MQYFLISSSVYNKKANYNIENGIGSGGYFDMGLEFVDFAAEDAIEKVDH